MTPIEPSHARPRPNLIARVTGEEEFAFDGVSESMWVAVIKRMDEVYSELLRNEADLEQKNAELENAQAFISSVIASVSDILIVCDEKTVIRQVNAAFVRLVGRPERELIGARLDAFVLPSDRERLAELHLAGREGRARESDVRFQTAGNSEECLALHCSAQFNADRRRIGVVFTGRPISELRRAYQALHDAHVELQQAQNRLIEQEKMASLGRLVAGVAHELNNPISFIYANIYTLERYLKTISAYFEALHGGASKAERDALRAKLKIDPIMADCRPLIEGTMEGATRVTEIVKNLRRLSFSKTTERGTLDLDKVLRTAVSLTARSKNAKAEITVDSAPDLYFEGNEGQIHQVVVNLIDNALYAVKDRRDGRVEVSLIRKPGAAEIVIRDNGVGIAGKDLSKIFEPFFTTKTVGEGTGLGLWISFSIVREYGGSIKAANLPTGGAEFTIELPTSAP
jgi:two-component system sensor histidine kinase HupT/HoxJ